MRKFITQFIRLMYTNRQRRYRTRTGCASRTAKCLLTREVQQDLIFST